MDVHPSEKVLRYHVYCIQQLLLPLLFLLLLRSSLLLVLCIYTYTYNYVYNVFHGPPPSVFKYSVCARFRDVVHVSEMFCTFHKPPNNVRVQLYTH